MKFNLPRPAAAILSLAPLLFPLSVLPPLLLVLAASGYVQMDANPLTVHCRQASQHPHPAYA